LAIKEKNGARALAYSALSYMILTASLYVWRLAAVMLAVYTLTLLYLAFREDGFFKKRSGTLAATAAMYLAMFLVVPGFGLRNIESNYSGFSRAAYEIIMKNLGAHIKLSDFTRLVYFNQELGGVTIPQMFGGMFLSLAGIFAVVYAACYLKDNCRRAEKDSLFVALVFMSALTFIFSRNKGMLGPLAALTLGESVMLIKRQNDFIFRRVLYALFALIIMFTVYQSWRLAVTRRINTRLKPEQRQALEAINRIVPQSEPLICNWADGYPIQTYCNRPTVTDGLFESPEIVRRIIAESRAYMSSGDDEFIGLCRAYGVKYILVPKDRKMAYSGYAGVPYGLLIRGNAPTARGMKTLLFRLIYRPQDQAMFQLLYDNKNFSLFKLKE
jgi:hypothetical protein